MNVNNEFVIVIASIGVSVCDVVAVVAVVAAVETIIINFVTNAL